MLLIGLAIGWMLRLLIVPAALLIVGGCATLTVVPAERLDGQRLTPAAEPVAHIYAANWGIYLFKYLPPSPAASIGQGYRSGRRCFATRCRSIVSSRRSVPRANNGAEQSSPICEPAIDRTG